MWLLIISYKRQTWDGFFDFWEENMTMDVLWCTLVPLLSPETEWWGYTYEWNITAQKYGWMDAVWIFYLFWQSSTRGSWSSTLRSTSFTDSSNHSITPVSFQRLQVLPTYRAVNSARAGGCLETKGQMSFWNSAINYQSYNYIKIIFYGSNC